MSPKVRYTTPPEADFHMSVYCTGSKCGDVGELENEGDGWECPHCGTFWDNQRIEPTGAEWQFAAEDLDGLPVYDEEGNEVKES